LASIQFLEGGYKYNYWNPSGDPKETIYNYYVMIRVRGRP